MKQKKRHALTLIEIMLVIVLIGVVASALAFNMKGALDRGRQFNTREARDKIEAILSMEAISENPETVAVEWENFVKNSPLMKFKQKNGQIVDGWGNPFIVEYDDSNNTFLVSSAKIDTDGNII